MKLHFASLSFGAAVDQQTGNLSVFDLLEDLRTPQVPVHLQSLIITLALEKKVTEPFKGKIFIHLITPDGKQAMVGNGELDVPAEQRRMKALFRFGGFPVAAFGEHRFVVSWLNGAGSKIGEAILDFDVVQTTQVAQGMSPSGERPSTPLN
jgi:hypothetical protein